jgi:hypothetical protein
MKGEKMKTDKMSQNSVFVFETCTVLNKIKEVNVMNSKKNIFAIAILWTLSTWAMAASGEPIRFRLNWQPGETFRYKFDMSANMSAAGERMQMGLETELKLHVIKCEGNIDPRQANGAKYARSDNKQTVSSGEHLMEVELEHGDIRMTIGAQGQKIVTVVGKNTVTASLNGRSLPSHQVAQLRKEIGPVQELLKSRIHLWMTRSGKVERVSGLEKLDRTMQKSLATDYLQGMMLPEKPLKLGEHFIDKRSLGTLFSSQPGNKKHPLADKTIDIVRTLKSIKPDGNGRKLAELTAPLEQRFKDVPFDENGSLATADFDIIYTTFFDIDRGNFVKETAKGTVLFYPKSTNMPSRVEMKINAEMTLVDTKESLTIARSNGRN